nr:nucleotide exchange factor GrpE [uncultured Marinifilum sp.]
MNINDILQKFPEFQELEKEKMLLVEHNAKLEEENKQKTEEIERLAQTESILNKAPEDIALLLNDLQEAKEKYEEAYKKLMKDKESESIAEENKEEAPKIVDESKASTFVKEKMDLIEKRVGKACELLDELAYKDNINRELHSELQLHKNGLNKEITKPVLKNIIHWHDRIEDLYHHYSVNQDENKENLFPKLLQEYQNLSNGLLDLLYDYDIESFEPKEEEVFTPKMHKVIDKIETEEEGKVKKIASCKKSGFQDVTTGRVLRPAEVIIYKVKEN